jgi:hypothetical protein
VPYTVWSRGRLIGQSDLAYRRTFPKLRAGDFYPSEFGEKLMSIITGVGPALLAFYDVVDAARLAGEEFQPNEHGDWPEKLRQSTEYADSESISDELASLALELRDESGAVVKTDWLRFQDTHRLLAQAHKADDELNPDFELDEELQAEIEEMRLALEDALQTAFASDPEPWNETEFARYQIMAALAGHDRYMQRAAKRLPSRKHPPRPPKNWDDP